jgi:hypothetical protein
MFGAISFLTKLLRMANASMCQRSVDAVNKTEARRRDFAGHPTLIFTTEPAAGQTMAQNALAENAH